ncbi:hypothetical protein CPB83DRAFT_872986 [Crepidotus variabilis]|uniref:Transmembrane protein n=1 Tax=Crepidotus variabilis TaxID=179855 RepID=A0A9P6ETK9_9AGAR|nr:hypothetical protein CPB83DRAFT_872986 [Crepidotus variabilis]
MPDWNTIEENLRDYEVVKKMAHVIFGVYLWEWLSSLPFEWDFVTGRKKIRWPLIFYLINRYSLLVFLVLQLTMFDAPSDRPFNCGKIYQIGYLFGQVALVTASINLTVRTIAIWSNIYVTAGLGLIVLANCVLVSVEIYYSTAMWIPGIGCVPNAPYQVDMWLRASFIYSVAFNLLVLALNLYKLSVGMGSFGPTQPQLYINPLKGTSRIAQLIFTQGLIYFFIAFLTDLVSIVFLTLKLNIAMSTIAVSPTLVISSIAACRSVRTLANFHHNNQPTYVLSVFQTPRQSNPAMSMNDECMIQTKSAHEGVIVHMETITTIDAGRRKSFV